MVTRPGGWGNGEESFNGCGDSVWGDEKVAEIGGRTSV